MILDADACYDALLARDRRYDGAFFVGVSTTGIYCRTVCPAKTPLRERCTFYPSAAAAEAAGHRPCLRCRPELAPGSARIDAVGRLAAAAASRIEEGDLEAGLDGLAAELGVSDRHLRRAIQQQFGVSPIELAQTHRLLLAKRLLTDTSLPVGEVAMASGFKSLRRFNALFKERYRMAPTDLRRRPAKDSEAIVCHLGYRPPYDWDSLLDYLDGRSTAGVEHVGDGRYMRTVCIGGHAGWISVENDAARSRVSVRVSAALAPALPKVLSRVRRVFDLDADPTAISAQLGDLAAPNPGLRLPGAWSGFELAVRAILGQQVTVRAATTIAGRVAARFGRPLETPFPELTTCSPGPACLAKASVDEVASLGIVSARAKSIIELARAVDSREIVLRPHVDLEETVCRLLALPGIGPWTAEYVAMRALCWPDAFPYGDLGIQKALGERDAKKVLALSERWRPWRAYAAIHLWKSLENK